jgi:hypothetical protein
MVSAYLSRARDESVLFVALELAFQEATQPDFMKNYDVVQAFAPKGTDQPLGIDVLPTAAGSVRTS